MVFFTCDACGESLKKNQVEKHYNHKCRRCSVLTCVDCQTDFPGDSYQSHTSCITEDEKYGGKNYQAKASANKGLKKQNAWIVDLQELVASKAGSLDDDVKAALDSIMKFENIPRKRAKFINFAKNILGGGRRAAPSTLEKVWDVFEEARAKKPEPAVEAEEKKAKKRGGGGGDNEENEGAKAKKAKKQAKFKWEEVMVEVLRRKGPEIKLTKLKKKVATEYASWRGTEAAAVDESKRAELDAKVEKKLKKSSLFKVAKGRVSLSEKQEEKEATFNGWENADLGDGAANEKFRRLMGLGKSASANGGGGEQPEGAQPQRGNNVNQSAVRSKASVAQMFADQEREFESVQANNNRKQKGAGLGFGSKAKNRVTTFEG